MIVTNWEAGTACTGCGDPIELGQEMLYGRCMPCGQLAARTRSDAPGDPLECAREALGKPGRIILTRRHMRSLIELARSDDGFCPVRRPDRDGSPPWYGRVRGWSPGRVARGLTAQETAGLWLDYLDSGRVPPVIREDLGRLVEAISARPAALS